MGAVIVAAAVVVILATGGSGGAKHRGQTTSTAPVPPPTAKVRLVSPTGSAGTVGIAEIVRHGSNAAIAILGKGLPQNTKDNAYAVWLYNSPSDAVRLGFVNPGVGKNGHLDTAGGLPANASRYSKLLITSETTANPNTPGGIVLEGSLRGPS